MAHVKSIHFPQGYAEGKVTNDDLSVIYLKS